MAWGYIASSAANNGNGGSGASVAVTLGAAVSVGDRIIVAVSAWQTTTNPSISSVTDDKGNSYTLDKSTGVFTQDPGFPQLVALYSAPVTTGGTPVITVAGTFEGLGAGVAAYSGLSTAAGAGAAVDVSASANGNNAAPGSGNTSNTTAANELIIGAFGDDGQNSQYQAANGSTLRLFRQTGSDAQVALQDLDSGASGSAKSSEGFYSIATAHPWGMVAVVYRLAGAGGPPFYADPPIGDRRPFPFTPGSAPQRF